jgi:hypothetical protein
VNDRDEVGGTVPSVRREGKDSSSELAARAVPSAATERFRLPEGVVDPELGRGGMGRVLRLKDPHLDREVAVKELLPEHRADPAMEGLFFAEARVLARLEHPGIVPVYEMGRRPDGVLFYAMRRIRGQSLEAALKACGGLDERLALLDHYLDVVQTVGFAHSRGVVHRDLKAENVMVSRFGETQVIDWGLAVVEGELGAAGVTAGTPRAMAPEQAAGRAVDERSDVFSLGALLYQLLTARPPFTGASVSDVLNAVQHLEATPIIELEPKAPLALVRVAERALAKEPSARFANAGDMADAVEAAMRARAPRSPVPRLVGLGLAVALSLALGWAIWLVTKVDQLERRAELDAAEATRTRRELAGRAALLALRAKDSLEAIEFAHQAIDGPLGRGVALLAREVGMPSRAWSVTTEAGCSSLAVVDDAIACGTLGGVALFGLADGQARGRLDTGPRGWQHAVAALPNHRLASGGDDRELRIFELGASSRGSAGEPGDAGDASRQVGEAQRFDEGITALAGDGERLWVGLRDGTVRPSDGEVLQQHARPVLSLAAAHGVVASSSGDGLQVTRPEGLASLERRAGALAFSGGSLLVGVERTVVSIDAQGAGTPWGGHRADVTALAVDGAAGRAMSGSADGELRWWSATGAPEGVARLPESQGGVRALLPAGDAVLVAMGKRLESWQLPAALRPAWEERPTALALLRQRRQVVAGFGDGRVRRVSWGGGPPETLELRHRGPVRALVEVPGEEAPAALRLLSGGDDGKVLAQRWNGEVETLAEEASAVRALAVSDDGARAAWVTEDGSRVLHSLEFGKEISRARGARGRAVAFAPDGRRWVVGSDDKRVTVLSAEDGKELQGSEPFDAPVSALVWASLEGVVVGAGDGTVAEWSIKEGRVVRSWRGGTASVTALGTGGGLLAGGTADGQVWLWVLTAPAPVAQLPAEAGEVLLVSLAAEHLVFAGTDRLVHVLEEPWGR